MKSKYIGKTIQDFLIHDRFYDLNKNGNRVAKFVVECVYCGKIQTRVVEKITHGHAKCDCQKNFKSRFCDRDTRLGNIHHGMLQRCENPNNDGYKYYGAKGISVCDEWQSYEPFRDWSLSNGYEDNLTIDRIDYTKGYSPENCRWTTYKTQANNKSSNHIITHNDKSQTVQMWGEELGIKPNTIITRLKRGWAVKDALSTNLHDCRVLSSKDVEYIKSNYIPRKVSAQKLADMFGVSKSAILNILHDKTYTQNIDSNLDDKCRTCGNLYSSFECDACENYDMYTDNK